ncbi:MAG TPA: hypothetical protein VK929_09525 [Longimicrobiales bacterium]|nr:hypothetical protein [Longimicrobiales bacterium]
MKTSTKVTLVVLVGTLVLAAVAVTRWGLGGTTFRAADYDTLQECMANIPMEWGPGSLERTRAEQACHYEAQRRAQQ